MKIISKYKDYYDFLQSKYGIDEKVVFERKAGSKTDYSQNTVYIFHILNQVYCGIKVNEEWVYKIEDLIHLFQNWSNYINNNYEKDYLGNYLYQNKQNFFEKTLIKDFPVSDLNTKENCPILVHTGYSIVRYPKLSDTFIPKLIPPDDMFVGLANWFSKKDIDVITKPEDMNRFESKGFDKKTSFRNIK